jgi:cytidyltransferase-like protein
MKIGVYVGSFNPPHKGHIKIVNHLIEITKMIQSWINEKKK